MPLGGASARCYLRLPETLNLPVNSESSTTTMAPARRLQEEANSVGVWRPRASPPGRVRKTPILYDPKLPAAYRSTRLDLNFFSL